MTWTLVGYFPKRRTAPDGTAWPGPPAPEPPHIVGSVTTCIAKGPDGWEDGGGYNYFRLYDSPTLAWSAVPAEVRPAFELFAYRLSLVRFERGVEQLIEAWWEMPVEPLGPAFERIGWDAVVDGSASFGCSPLTCNGQTGRDGIPPVNRYCLVDTEAEGVELARIFSLSEPEPGPYCVVEVWREAAAATTLPRTR